MHLKYNGYDIIVHNLWNFNTTEITSVKTSQFILELSTVFLISRFIYIYINMIRLGMMYVVRIKFVGARASHRRDVERHPILALSS